MDAVPVTVERWLDEAPEGSEAIETRHAHWPARSDRAAHPFADEYYWAAFYVPGLVDWRSML